MSVALKSKVRGLTEGSRTHVAGGASDSFDPTSLPRSTARNWKGMALGAGLIAAGGLVAAIALGDKSAQTTAIVAAKPIRVGSVISPSDLRAVRLSAGLDLRSLPAGAANQLIGGVAAVPIAQGTLLLAEQVNQSQGAPEGTVLVGTVLDPGALPSPDLRYGDRVKVLVASQLSSADDPSKIVTEAIVWRVWGGTPGSATSSSKQAVTLAIPEDTAVTVGEAAARGNIRLLVVPTSTKRPTEVSIESAQAPADPALVAPASPTKVALATTDPLTGDAIGGVQ